MTCNGIISRTLTESENGWPKNGHRWCTQVVGLVRWIDVDGKQRAACAVHEQQVRALHPERQATRSEWSAEATCPSCGWTGTMQHIGHPTFGMVAFCANPEPIDQDADDAGRPFNVYCRNRDDGFDIGWTEGELREAYGR